MASSVRVATSQDIQVLVELMEEFYAEAGFPLNHAWAADAFATLLANAELGVTWLLLQDDAPAGYLVFTLRFSMEFGGLDGFIDDLFVRAPFRRLGLARQALGVLFAEARRRGALAVHVVVGSENSAAQALYSTFGLELPQDGRQMLSVSLASAQSPSAA